MERERERERENKGDEEKKEKTNIQNILGLKMRTQRKCNFSNARLEN